MPTLKKQNRIYFPVSLCSLAENIDKGVPVNFTFFVNQKANLKSASTSPSVEISAYFSAK